MRRSAAFMMATLAGCAMAAHEAAPTDSADPGNNGSDGSGSGSGAGSGAGSNTTPPPAHVPLLLSEISLGPAGHEFVEIVNPTTFAVPLYDLYLSDNGSYFKLPAGSPTLTSGDFIVKFPDNDIVPAHGVITVALDTTTAFNSAFGANPTYSIADANLTVVAAQAPSLTDTGEVLVLFQWDGTSPLVRDVDIMIAGVPTTGNAIVAKSGYSQLTNSYKTDAMTIGAQASAPAAGKSTKRILRETGHEAQAGTGNGVEGDDETSEATNLTWDSTASFSAPTPGQVPAALLQ
ncbi:MAG: hypothetical protein ABJE66_03975 [Deltaproteobacteria bacterium]